MAHSDLCTGGNSLEETRRVNDPIIHITSSQNPKTPKPHDAASWEIIRWMI